MTVIAPVERASHGGHFRAFGLRRAARLIDPFIGVDHAWMSAPTFPPHRHAGFSAISYLFLDSETGIDNRDSTGTQNIIRPGGLHWATAGAGLVHEEVPAEEGKTVHSLQIFVNLAPDKRTVAPFALPLEPEDIPVVHRPGAKVRVPLGCFADVRSPLDPPTDVTMLDITLDDGAQLTVPVAAGEAAFVLPVFGVVEVEGQRFERDDLKVPVFEALEAERSITLRSAGGNVKAMLFSGRPLGRFPA